MTRPDSELTEGHLWQIDIVRLLAFGAVIAVHSVAFTQQPSNQVAAGALMVLQYGREVFFALTGFVLVHTAQQRTATARSFWQRRLPAVAVPYLAWTAIYYLYSVIGPAHLHPSWSGLGADVLNGGAFYHLYFLLVTMQLYVVFGWLLAFVRRTRRHAWPILAAVGAVNLAWLAALQYVAAPSGTVGFLWHHAYQLLPTYTIYVLAGCYAALHLAKLQSFVRRYRRSLTAGALAAMALAVGGYVAQLGGRAPRDAAAVLQPAMLLSSAGAAVLLYLAGSRWAAGARRHAPTVRVASDISFGVYLAHPLFLALLTDHGLGNSGQLIPTPLATVVGFVVPLAAAAGVALVARRSPASLMLVGRRRLEKPGWEKAPRPWAPALRGAPVVAAGQSSVG